MAKDSHEQRTKVFERWWRELNDSDDVGERGERANRADAARLRRVGVIDTPTGPEIDVALALTIESFRTLYGRIRMIGEDLFRREADLIVSAVTLAHIRKRAPGRSTAEMLGVAPGADQPLMSESRFLRLMRTRTSAGVLAEGRRIAALLKDGAPVGDLGASLLVWLDDPVRRRTWARAYYGLSLPPAQNTPSTQTPPELESLQS
jgi:CRISPR type I-E-associated protein CasB/Cse2